MALTWSRGLAWSVGVFAGGVALASACGGKEEGGTPPVVYEEPDATPDVVADQEPVDVACTPIGALSDCTIDFYENGIHSCFTGQQVCRGEDGWTECLDSGKAAEVAAELTAAGQGGTAGGATTAGAGG